MEAPCPFFFWLNKMLNCWSLFKKKKCWSASTLTALAVRLLVPATHHPPCIQTSD
jgi:hypothetical protein